MGLAQTGEDNDNDHDDTDGNGDDHDDNDGQLVILGVVRLAVQAATDKLATLKKNKLKELVPANQEVSGLGERGSSGQLDVGQVTTMIMMIMSMSQQSPVFVLEICVLVWLYPHISPRAAQSSSVIAINLHQDQEPKCPLDNFELIYFSAGPKGKSFVCPYRFNNPPFRYVSYQQLLSFLNFLHLSLHPPGTMGHGEGGRVFRLHSPLLQSRSQQSRRVKLCRVRGHFFRQNLCAFMVDNLSLIHI